jgi:hypothetical protein
MSHLLIAQSVFERAGLYPAVRSGVSLSFSVLENLPSGKLRILLSGKELVVESRLNLQHGFAYRATVQRAGDQFLLKLTDPPRPDLILREIVQSSLGEQGKELVTLLLQAGVPVREQTLLRFARLAERFSADRTGRRLLSLLLGKGIDPEAGESYRRLLPLFSGDGDTSSKREKGGDKRKDREDDREGEQRRMRSSIREAVSSSQKEGSLLTLFNHLSSNGEQWLIVPLPKQERGDLSLNGVLRLRFSRMDRKTIDRVVLTISTEDGGKSHFYVNTAENPCRLTLYLSGELAGKIGRQGKLRRSFLFFNEKLNNLGIKIDDIKSEEYCDGCRCDEELNASGIDTRV